MLVLAFLGIVMLVEHTSEFLLWAGHALVAAESTIALLKFDVGDVGEIIGVGAIVGYAIITDEIRKRRAKTAAHVKATANA